MQEALYKREVAMKEKFDLEAISHFLRETLATNPQVDGVNISRLPVEGQWHMRRSDYPNMIQNSKWVLDYRGRGSEFMLTHDMSDKRIVVIRAKWLERDKFELMSVSIGYAARTQMP